MTPEIERAVRITRDEFFTRLNEVQFAKKDKQVIETARQNICQAELDGLMVKFYQLGDEFYTEFSPKPQMGFRRDL